VAGFSQAAVKAMYNYGFPGNIRELQNLVERGVILVSDGEAIDVHHLFSSGESLAQNVLSLAWRDGGPATLSLLGTRPTAAADEAADTVPGASQSGALEQAELALLRQAIRRSGGNLAAAARDLGVSRATVAYRAKKFGLVV
jgi:transcriptional regulator with PAS, ATPase and Fis domain